MRLVQKSLLLISILFAGCSPTTKAVPNSTTPQPAPTQQLTAAPQVNENLKQLAEEFQTLREIPGQFSGGGWQDEVDQWQGRKHSLMIDLGLELGNGNYSRTQLITLLGQPDHIVKGGDPLADQITSLPANERFTNVDEFLVYEWRGTHDFLFFVIQDGRSIGSDWWYSGE